MRAVVTHVAGRHLMFVFEFVRLCDRLLACGGKRNVCVPAARKARFFDLVQPLVLVSDCLPPLGQRLSDDRDATGNCGAR